MFRAFSIVNVGSFLLFFPPLFLSNKLLRSRVISALPFPPAVIALGVPAVSPGCLFISVRKLTNDEASPEPHQAEMILDFIFTNWRN